MIVTKRESMASLIHDTKKALHYDIVCNKVIIRACIMDSEMPGPGQRKPLLSRIEQLPQLAQPRYHARGARPEDHMITNY